MNLTTIKNFKIPHLLYLLILVNLSSCNKEELSLDESTSSSENTLYQPENTYTPKKFDLIWLKPPHRSGPNLLTNDEYSMLPITVWVPEGVNKPIPTIIYSHGGGSRANPGESGAEWGAFLAKAGYAFIAMHHMARSSEDIIKNICDPLSVDEQKCDQALYVPYYESTDRPQDAVFIMNNLSKISNDIGVNLDVEKIAIFGFSGGTNTTHYLAGGERDALFGFSPNPEFFKLSDDRPKAYIAMSCGAGLEGGWTEESLNSIAKPFLCATGIGDLSGNIRANFFEQLKGNDQYRFFINSIDALHITFNHQAKGTPDQEKIQAVFHLWLEMTTLAFLDAYVLENGHAKTWLRSPNIKQLAHERLEEHPLFKTWTFR